LDFYEVVKSRRSYRAYKPELPDQDKIERILEAARLAPTWANMQGMHYIIVKNPNKVKAVWRAIGQKQKFAEAPMFIVGVISEIGSGTNGSGEKYYPVDFGICFEHLILAATAEGLASCWIGWFDENQLKSELDIPKKFRILGLTPLGYPIKPKGPVQDRNSLDKIVHYDKF
jgi:nitroreductase